MKPKVVVCPPEIAKLCWCATRLGARWGWGAGSEGRRLRSLPQAAAARTYLLTRTGRQLMQVMYLPAPSPHCSPKMYGDGYEMGEPAALPAWHLRLAWDQP